MRFYCTSTGPIGGLVGGNTSTVADTLIFTYVGDSNIHNIHQYILHTSVQF